MTVLSETKIFPVLLLKSLLFIIVSLSFIFALFYGYYRYKTAPTNLLARKEMCTFALQINLRDTKNHIVTIFDQGKYRYLKLTNAGEIIRITTPLEYNTQNWILTLRFNNNILIKKKLETAEGNS